MIENITSPNQYVCHYTKAATAIQFILKDKRLLLGNYNKTNDPKESKNWEFNLGTNEERSLSKYNMKELSASLSSNLKNKTKIACFSMDTGPLSGNHLKDIFNRGFCKPRMWAQYCEKHTGVCLVFDHQKLINKIKESFEDGYLVLQGSVIYKNRNIVPNLYSADDQQYMINVDRLDKVGMEAYTLDHLMSHYKRLFFEKMMDWRDETEWRCVIFSETIDEVYIDIQDSLTGIIFGDCTEEKDIKAIMDMSKSLDLKYIGLKWKNCSPWYDYGNLRSIPGIENSPWGALVK